MSTRSSISTLITTNLPDNTSQYITPARLRQVVDALNASNANLDTDVPSGLISTNNEVLRTALQAAISGSTLKPKSFYLITNAVGSTRALIVQASAVNSIYSYAIDVATGQMGVYNIAADTFVPAAPSGTAGGDLTGTYPNPEVNKIHGVDMQAGTPTANDVWVYGGSPAKWQHQSLNSDQVVEGGTNLFFTTARARAAFSAGTGITITSGVIATTITQYTDAMARAAITLTTTGTSGAATYSSVTGVLNIPQYQAAGTYVTSLSVTTNQGVSGSFTTGSTPALTISLGALTGVTSLNGLVVTANTGVVTTGTWNASVVAGQYGGTGVANTGKTITVSGNTSIGSSTHTVTLATSANTSVTLPTSGTIISSVTALSGAVTGTPSASTYLRGDGTWASVSASAGGSNTQVQYNSSGALTGDASFTYDATNKTLSVGNATSAVNAMYCNGDLQVVGVAKLPTTFNRQTASYTLVLTDAYKMIETNNASANNVTIPPNSSVAFPVGTTIDVAQYGAGQTTIVAGSGVTLRSAGGFLKLSAQYSVASIRKVGTDEWYVYGQLTS